MPSQSVQKSLIRSSRHALISLSFNGYKIPRLDLLRVHAPMIISLLYFAISIGFQWNIALYTKFFFWLLSVFMDLLQIILQTWFKNTNLLATYDHLPSSNLFHYQFLPCGQRSFRYATPQPWNYLPYHVKDSKTLGQFKSSLKTHLFALAFWDEWCCWC